jgi:hypothetical protein
MTIVTSCPIFRSIPPWSPMRPSSLIPGTTTRVACLLTCQPCISLDTSTGASTASHTKLGGANLPSTGTFLSLSSSMHASMASSDPRDAHPSSAAREGVKSPTPEDAAGQSAYGGTSAIYDTVNNDVPHPTPIPLHKADFCLHTFDSTFQFSIVLVNCDLRHCEKVKKSSGNSPTFTPTCAWTRTEQPEVFVQRYQ